MSEKPKTPLQRFMSEAVRLAPETRDYYDKLIQQQAGIKGKPLWDLERGKSLNPSATRLQEMAEALSQPIELVSRAARGEDVAPRPYQAFGQGKRTTLPVRIDQAPDQPLSQRPDSDGETVDIIAVDLSVSMGPGTLVEDFYEQEPVKFDLALLRSITNTSSDRLRLIRGIGTSMEPVLRTGDRILVDINDRSLSRIDGYYWITWHDAHGLKRLRPAGKGRVLIISENPANEPIEVDRDEVRIEGRAIWFARDL